MVRDLAPSELSADSSSGAALPALLREAGRQAGRHGRVQVEVAVHGDPVPLPDQVATALLRTARGALANVTEHAAARRATLTLTFHAESVSVDIRDDGRGFDPAALSSRPGRGRGLAGIRARAVALGGELVVESAPGEGTALAVSLPLGPSVVVR